MRSYDFDALRALAGAVFLFTCSFIFTVGFTVVLFDFTKTYEAQQEAHKLFTEDCEKNYPIYQCRILWKTGKTAK
jgi:hypothetical protein